MQDVMDIKAGRGKQRHSLIIGALVTALGLWAFFFTNDALAQREVTAAGLVLFGLGIVGWALFRQKAEMKVLTLSHQGIWFERWGPVTVPWAQISQLYARGGRLQRFLCLELADPQAFVKSLPEDSRKAFEKSELVKLPLLLIPYGAVDLPPSEVAEHIERFRQG